MTGPLVFRLDRHGFFWTARAVLPSWQGYLDRGGDGSVEIVFAPEGRDDRPLSDDEQATVATFLADEPAVSAAVKAAIAQAYPAIRQGLADDGLLKVIPLPELATADDLKALVGLYAVNIHPLAPNGFPYAGYEFGCRWDEEHGLGVLTHGARIVEVGEADTAILLWKAEEDAGVGQNMSRQS